jgi:hypothetical protein
MTNNKSWMGNANELIKDTPLCLLPIPGSHDSGSFGDYATSGTAKTQSLSVVQQLELGIRFFDFRIRANDKTFFIHHGPTPTENDVFDKQGKGIFADVRTFVTENKGEIVILHCWDMDNSSDGGSGFASDDERNQAFVDAVNAAFMGKLIPPMNDGAYATVGSMLLLGNVMVILDFATSGSRGSIWQQNDCIVDYYSAPTVSVPTVNIESGGSSEGATLTKMKTLTDGLVTAFQQTRDTRKLYKTQMIFAYDAVLVSGFDSMMEYGAQRLNPVGVAAFREWILDSRNREGQPMNIIIADFVQYGGMVEAIVSAIRNEWPVGSVAALAGVSGTPAFPLAFNSKDGSGWLTGNTDREVIGGSTHEPTHALISLWVKGGGSYGVLDFAPVYGLFGTSGSTSIPDSAAWHYGHMYKSIDDVKQLAAPQGAHITGIDVVEAGEQGIVNVRVRYSDGTTSPPAWSDAATSPWTEGARTGGRITALESASQGGYGVVDVRYAIAPQAS